MSPVWKLRSKVRDWKQLTAITSAINSALQPPQIRQLRAALSLQDLQCWCDSSSPRGSADSGMKRNGFACKKAELRLDPSWKCLRVPRLGRTWLIQTLLGTSCLPVADPESAGGLSRRSSHGSEITSLQVKKLQKWHK